MDIKPFLLAAIVINLLSCSSGNIHIPIADNVETRRGIHSAKVVAVLGVPSEQSNIYQEDLEMEIVRVLKKSQMFAQVTFNENIPDDIDYLINFEPADLTYSRNAVSGALLTLGTLTLYLFFGGPVIHCSEHYSITLNVNDNSGNHLFKVSIDENTYHTDNLYNSEGCIKFHTAEIIDKLITKLGHRLSPVPEFTN